MTLKRKTESAESWQGHNCHRLTLEDTVLVVFLVAVSKYPIKAIKEELILTHALRVLSTMSGNG